MNKKRVNLLTICIFSSVLWGCGTPVNEPVQDKTTVRASTSEHDIPRIISKIEPIALKRPEICDAENCTKYQLQTVQTNVDWINQYFKTRIQEMASEAFAAGLTEPVKTQDVGLSQNSISVRYLHQWGDIATFLIDTYSYNAGAAHGLYHLEYVNLDLANHRRLSLNDIIIQTSQAKLLQALYDANQFWLEQHRISPEQLQLSDNFYYGTQGIVFVYPLYELASYAEGLSELALPYTDAKQFIQPKYLPNLPQSDL